MKNKLLILGILISLVLLIFSAIHLGFKSLDFVGTKSPEYYKHVQERINFGTFQCKNTIQWDTTVSGIDNFFQLENQYEMPDSLGIRIIEYSGPNLSQIDRYIYFKGNPKEIYLVTFDSGSFNHLDHIYSYKNDSLMHLITDTLPDYEKTRILSRLKTEILSQIDWDVSDIQFPKQ